MFANDRAKDTIKVICIQGIISIKEYSLDTNFVLFNISVIFILYLVFISFIEETLAQFYIHSTPMKGELWRLEGESPLEAC